MFGYFLFIYVSLITKSLGKVVLESCCPVQIQDIVHLNYRTCQCLSSHPSTTAPPYLLHTALGSWSNVVSPTLTNAFPIDFDTRNYVREVRHAIFSKTNPTPFSTPVHLAAYSGSVLSDILNLHSAVTHDSSFIDLVSGGGILSTFEPLTHRYGGHQFGHWAGQLGDGRAHLISEFVNHQGKHVELQLKGSGKTPYSRRGDGRAVLRSSVREYLCSEAMHHLGIPTSRAVTLAVSGDFVWRDQFYDGNPIKENTAVVLRLAESWFRFGSFEILAYNGEINLLKTLTDFVIAHYFPDIANHDPDRYLEFYSSVVRQTAMLMAKWQSVGFTHGVCNTDNFSILSVTIDYGPFRFMDEYDPNMVPNTSDDEAMYSYQNQPKVGKFNLNKLRLALEPLLTVPQRVTMKQILSGYDGLYQETYLTLFRNKLGLVGIHDQDENLIEMLLEIMHSVKSDFIMTFRQLGDWSIQEISENIVPKSSWALLVLEKHEQFKHWANLYFQRMQITHITDKGRRVLMHSVNPRYVLRNWIAQDVIKTAEKGDYTLLHKVEQILKRPFDEQEDAELLGFADPPPLWADHIKVSCSS